MSHLTSCIPLKTEGLLTGALRSCTQMNPRKTAFLTEDPLEAHAIRVITLQTSLFCHSKGEACKRTCYAEGTRVERSDRCSDFSKTTREFQWVQTKLFLKTILLTAEIEG